MAYKKDIFVNLISKIKRKKKKVLIFYRRKKNMSEKLWNLCLCYKTKEIERQDKEMWEWNNIWTFLSGYPHSTQYSFDMDNCIQQWN